MAFVRWCANYIPIHVQWNAVITRSDIVRYYMINYKKCVRMSTRPWIHKRHPIPRPSGRAMGCPLRIFWENGPRYNGTALYIFSWLTRVCAVTTPSHYQNQWCTIVNWTLGKKSSMKIELIFIQQNAFESIVCKMSAILFRHSFAVRTISCIKWSLCIYDGTQFIHCEDYIIVFLVINYQRLLLFLPEISFS